MAKRNLKNDNETWQQASVRFNLVKEEQINMSQESENDVFNENFDIFNERDWMAIAVVMSNAVPENIRIGNRDIDLLHDWTAAYNQYPDKKKSFFYRKKS